MKLGLYKGYSYVVTAPVHCNSGPVGYPHKTYQKNRRSDRKRQQKQTKNNPKQEQNPSISVGGLTNDAALLSASALGFYGCRNNSRPTLSKVHSGVFGQKIMFPFSSFACTPSGILPLSFLVFLVDSHSFHFPTSSSSSNAITCAMRTKPDLCL